MSQIFFVYDVSSCKEDDDPKDAVLYFHPVHVCETQRYSICCQLAGVVLFLKSSFTTPSIINLDRGKFAFHVCQKYLLVLGGNTEVLNETLKLQLQCLYGTFRFYYRSIDDVYNLFKGERVLFLKEMQKAWSQCLLVSQCYGSSMHLMFNSVPLLSSSEPHSQQDKKNASSISGKVKRLLQICQMNSGVVAGAVFCDNLLLYSQLTPQLTKYLTFLLQDRDTDFMNDPYVSTKLPPSVKLKSVYLSQTELNDILKYNHQFAGSQFRYHCHRETHPLSCASANSSCGSDGDVDSANTDDDSGKVPEFHQGFQSHEYVNVVPCHEYVNVESEHPASTKVKSIKSCPNFLPHNLGRCRASKCSICFHDSRHSLVSEASKKCQVAHIFNRKEVDQSVNIVHDTLYSGSVLLRRHHSMGCVASGREKRKELEKTIHVDDLKKFQDIDSALVVKDKRLCKLKYRSSDSMLNVDVRTFCSWRYRT